MKGYAITHYRDWAYEAAGLLLVALLVAMVGLYFHWAARVRLPFDAFENEPGPPAPLALSREDLDVFDAQTVRLKVAAAALINQEALQGK